MPTQGHGPSSVYQSPEYEKWAASQKAAPRSNNTKIMKGKIYDAQDVCSKNPSFHYKGVTCTTESSHHTSVFSNPKGTNGRHLIVDADGDFTISGERRYLYKHTKYGGGKKTRKGRKASRKQKRGTRRR